MKRALMLCLTVITLITFAPIKANAKEPEIRAELARVDAIYPSTDAVYFITADGNRYYFTGAEDWEIGDYFIAVFDTKGTRDYVDDELILTRYIGGWDYLTRNI